MIAGETMSSLCSTDDCTTPFDVHCFHCQSNMCSYHYFEHKEEEEQQHESTIELDDPMEDLLELVSSKWFCITNGQSSISKKRRSFSNPFVSSTYLLEKMKQGAVHRRHRVKSKVITRRAYRSRKRSKKRRRKLLNATAVNGCGTSIKTKFRNNKICNRKLPSTHHNIE